MTFNSLLFRGLLAVKHLFQKKSGEPGKNNVSIPHLILGMILYGVLPFDALPDFIPAIGQADDGMVILILSAIIVRILLQRKRNAPKTRAPDS